MAGNKSAEKRERQSLKRRERRRSRRSRVATFVKAVIVCIDSGNYQGAMDAFRVAQGELMRSVSAGLMRKATAARKVSRLSTRIKQIKV